VTRLDRLDCLDCLDRLDRVKRRVMSTKKEENYEES
jgi:hypothetical protein